jgi:3D (Asp-Asp-Asp) domain-containing protein
MAKERKAYAPFSLTSEAGVAQTPVEGYIDVRQEIYPTVSTGTINENGKWAGVKSSDTEFFGITTHVAVPNGGETVSPDTGNVNSIDMTGFNNIFIAIKPTNGGSYALTAVMGPDTNRFANLEPVNAGANLRGAYRSPTDRLDGLFSDSDDTLTADVWNIFSVFGTLADQKNMQLKVTNNSGGNSTFEVAFLRVV